MEAFSAGRIVRILAGFLSIWYYAMWFGAALILIGFPVARIVGADVDFRLTLSARPTQLEEPLVATSWGEARVRMEDARVRVSFPLASVPWSFVALFMLHAFVAMAFVMYAIHNVRRIFQRVRDGSPFDSENAERMRAAGLSLVGLAVFGVVDRVLVPFLTRGLAVEPPNVSAAVSVDSTHLWFSPLPDFPVLFVALVLLALGTIFKRGAELEQEQSLVV